MKKLSTLILLFLAIQSFAQVGIGTTTPLARLHVVDSSVLFSAEGYAPVTAGLPPVNGLGRRMMWYSDKAAFRAGFAEGDNWDIDSTGFYSMALGYNPTARGYGSIALGYNASASGDWSISMGFYNKSTAFSSVAIGLRCRATGEYSTAIGTYTSTNGHEGACVIGDHSNTGYSGASTNDDQMTMRFAGGYRLFTNSPATVGVTLAVGGASWSSVCDRRKKENFRQIDNEDILRRVAALPLSNWNYKSQPVSQRHIGPMAQDFYAAFQLDGIGNDTTINTIDIDGVNMAAIQALEKRTRDLQLENAFLTSTVVSLQQTANCSDPAIARLEEENRHLMDTLIKMQQQLDMLQSMSVSTGGGILPGSKNSPVAAGK